MTDPVSPAEGEDGPQPVLRVKVNLGAPRVRLAHRIQAAMDHLAFGMMAGQRFAAADLRRSDLNSPESLEASEESPSAPATDADLSIDPFLHVRLAPAKGRSIDEARVDFEAKLLGRGLNDCIAALSDLLVATHRLAVFITSEEEGWERRIREADEGQRSFGRLPLPDKFSRLRADFSIGAETALEEEVTSIAVGRNCLEHRGGIVSQVDLNNGDQLTIRWRRMRLMAGDHELTEPGVVVANQAVSFDLNAEGTKSFSVGELVELSPREMLGVFWTFNVFGTQVHSSLSQFVKDRGLVAPDSPDSNDDAD